MKVMIEVELPIAQILRECLVVVAKNTPIGILANGVIRDLDEQIGRQVQPKQEDKS